MRSVEASGSRARSAFIGLTSVLYSAPFLGAAVAEIHLLGWRALRSVAFGITVHGANAIRQTLGRSSGRGAR